MSTRCKLAGLLTPSQSELLKTLFELHQQMGPEKYWRPKDLGAYRSSHHAMTLKRLQERGLVEREAVEPSGHSFGYRISNSGVETWDLMLDAAQVPLHSIFGGSSVRERAKTLAKLAA